MFEEPLIGEILRQPDIYAEVAGVVRPEHFFNIPCGEIFRLAGHLLLSDKEINVYTILQESKSGLLTQDYLIALKGADPVNALDAAKAVRADFQLRQLQDLGDAVATGRLGGDVTEVASALHGQLLSIMGEGDASEMKSLTDIGDAVIANILAARQSTEKITGLSSGLKKLDGITGGFRQGDLVIVAGRPGMGKTSCALGIGLHAAMEGKKVVLFSLEMTKEQLWNRAASWATYINGTKIRDADLTDEEMGQLVSWHGQSQNISLYIDDSSKLTVEDVAAKVRMMASIRGVDLVIVDYISLLQGTGRSYSKEQEVSHISRSCKTLAVREKIPVILVSQLSRRCEERVDKRPLLSDLRDSGAIEQDADMVIFPWREEMYGPTVENKGVAEMILAKNRSGETGTTRCLYLASATRFEDFPEDVGYNF